MPELASLSYGIAACAFFVLAVLLALARGERRAGLRLVAASAITVGWAVVFAWPGSAGRPPLVAFAAEVVRQAAWIVVVTGLFATGSAFGGAARAVYIVTGTLTGLMLAAIVVGGRWFGFSLLFGGLALAVLTLVLLEQVYRNAEPDQRGALRYLYIGVGGMSVYDLFLYSQGLLLDGLTVEAWTARGAVFALAVPFIAIAAKRIPEWSLHVFVSRQATLFSTTLLAIGGYLLLMALGGYAVRLFGGVWGPTAQIIFVAVAVALLAAAVTSATLRNRARVFLLKHFYRHKYDYREEWLRFIATLSESSETDAPQMAAARAMAQIISSPAAVLLRCRSRGRPMDVIAAWPADNADVTRAAQLGAIAPLVRLLAEREWVVDLDEHRGGEAPEGELPLPAWLLRGEWRLIVPVMLRRELFGLLLLAQPGKGFRLTYEDRDLLKTAARHVATHLAQHEAEQRVAEGQQFEAYSKLTAFMMHDLKNTVAQLQLVVDNARSHRHNPEFVDDAFDTVRNAADRIGRLIEQLQRGVAEGRRRRIDLGAAVRRAAELCADRAPRPTVARLPPQLEVVADRERLTDVIQHVIRNAQEATPQDGSVRIALSSGDGQAVVEVSDTGAGMTPEFVRDGLFRPFHSTKGAKGMGVGAYQAREYLRSLGGDVEVRSQPGRGTDFRLILPIADTTEPDRGHDA